MQHNTTRNRVIFRKETEVECEDTNLSDVNTDNLILMDKSNEVEDVVDENITEMDHETTEFEEEKYADDIRTRKVE